jgi:hypothetical protein
VHFVGFLLIYVGKCTVEHALSLWVHLSIEKFPDECTFAFFSFLCSCRSLNAVVAYVNKTGQCAYKVILRRVRE